MWMSVVICLSAHLFSFLCACIFFSRHLYRDFEIQSGCYPQVLFASTFSLSTCLLFLLMFEALQILSPVIRTVTWRIDVSLLLLFIYCILPVAIVRAILEALATVGGHPIKKHVQQHFFDNHPIAPDDDTCQSITPTTTESPEQHITSWVTSAAASFRHYTTTFRTSPNDYNSHRRRRCTSHPHPLPHPLSITDSHTQQRSSHPNNNHYNSTTSTNQKNNKNITPDGLETTSTGPYPIRRFFTSSWWDNGLILAWKRYSSLNFLWFLFSMIFLPVLWYFISVMGNLLELVNIDNLNYVEILFAHIGICGVTIISILAGFGSVYYPYRNINAFLSPVSKADIWQVEQRLESILSQICTLRAEYEVLQMTQKCATTICRHQQRKNPMVKLRMCTNSQFNSDRQHNRDDNASNIYTNTTARFANPTAYEQPSCGLTGHTTSYRSIPYNNLKDTFGLFKNICSPQTAPPYIQIPSCFAPRSCSPSPLYHPLPPPSSVVSSSPLRLRNKIDSKGTMKRRFVETQDITTDDDDEDKEQKIDQNMMKNWRWLSQLIFGVPKKKLSKTYYISNFYGTDMFTRNPTWMYQNNRNAFVAQKIHENGWPASRTLSMSAHHPHNEGDPPCISLAGNSSPIHILKNSFCNETTGSSRVGDDENNCLISQRESVQYKKPIEPTIQDNCSTNYRSSKSSMKYDGSMYAEDKCLIEKDSVVSSDNCGRPTDPSSSLPSSSCAALLLPSSSSFSGSSAFGFADIAAKLRHLERKIDVLERLSADLFAGLDEMVIDRARVLYSRTPLGKLNNLSGWLMSVVCMYRIIASLTNIIFSRVSFIDPITKFLVFTFDLFALEVYIDIQLWIPYLSFLLIGYIIILNIRSFVDKIIIVFRMYTSNRSVNIIALITTEIMAFYFSSFCLLMRIYLPEEYRHDITELLGKELDYKAYHLHFDLVYVLSSCVAVLILGVAESVKFGKFKAA